MERLTTHDQKDALGFLRDAYGLREFEQFVQLALHGLPTLIRSEVTSYNEMDPCARRSRNWVVPEQPPERDEAWESVMDQEPVLAHHAKNLGGPLVRLADFLSSRELRNRALFSEHYGPLGQIEDTLGFIWQTRAGTMNAFGLLRRKRFNDRELALVEFLRPHLILAHANAIAFSTVTSTATQLRTAIDASARALVVLGRDRTIRFATQCALDWICEYFGRAVAAQRLPEPLDLWVRQHDSALQQLLELPRPRDPLVIDRKDRRLVVRLLSGETELMLLLEQQNTLIEPSSLRSLGLTARENEVLAGMANGHTKAEIAHALAISPRTIDAHVQKIYNRLGVTTLNGAAARAFQATRRAAARGG